MPDTLTVPKEEPRPLTDMERIMLEVLEKHGPMPKERLINLACEIYDRRRRGKAPE